MAGESKVLDERGLPAREAAGEETLKKEPSPVGGCLRNETAMKAALATREATSRQGRRGMREMARMRSKATIGV